MSDLSGKFNAVGTEIQTNHEALMGALEALTSAVGGLPTDTFADLLTAIAMTNTLLSGMRSDMNTKLNNIFETVDSINNNNSLNAQRLMTLMLQTACPCDSSVPLLPPPLDTVPTEAAADVKCQRIQYFLDLFTNWVITCVVYLQEVGSISSFQVDNQLALQFESIPLDDSDIRPIPTSIRDWLTSALNSNGSPSAIEASIFGTLTTGTVIADMRQALYAQDNAADGSNAAKNAIDMSGGPFANIISTMFFSGWPNVMYGALPVIDASDYDGTICAPPVVVTCWTFTSSVVASNYGPATAVTDLSPLPSVSQADYGTGRRLTGDYFGWTITPTNSNLYIVSDAFGNTNITTPFTITSHTTYLFPNGVAAFEFELCQPEEL